jgi:hypothetical protein
MVQGVWNAELYLHHRRAEAAEKLAGEGGRGRQDKEDLHLDKEEHAPAHKGSNPPVKGNKGTQQTEPLHRKGGIPQRVKVRLTARRVRIDPEAKRAKYLNRLELLIQELDSIIDDPKGVEDVQLEAMDVLIRAVQLCYRIVRDIDVEVLENELAEIKERTRRERKERGGEVLGYKIEEDPAD